MHTYYTSHSYAHLHLLFYTSYSYLHFFWSSWQAGCPRLLVSDTVSITTLLCFIWENILSFLSCFGQHNFTRVSIHYINVTCKLDTLSAFGNFSPLFFFSTSAEKRPKKRSFLNGWYKDILKKNLECVPLYCSTLLLCK